MANDTRVSTHLFGLAESDSWRPNGTGDGYGTTDEDNNPNVTDNWDFDTCEEQEVTTLFNLQQYLPSFLHLKKKFKKKKQGEIINGEFTPERVSDFQGHPHQSEWWDSYNKELQSFRDNNVFNVINRCDVPSGHRIHTLTPVFKIKTTQDGATLKRKSRITLRGFNTVKGKEYEHTYAPCLQQSTFKMLMAIMTQYRLVGTSCDIATAFLTAPASHPLYCELPENYLPTNDKTKVALCNKSIYGAKDASRSFWLAVSENMKKQGFTMSHADPCLWVKGTMETKDYIAVAWYVDDATSHRIRN